MYKTFIPNVNRLPTTIGLLLSSVFLIAPACTTYVQEPPRRAVYEPAPRVVYVEPPAYIEPRVAPRVEAVVAVSAPVVEIRAESDFYEPLTQYGRWEVVGGYGRCWIPARVEADWRPYCNGHWQRTDAGWYWASEEPWGWATYHYGRWDLSPQFGWYWIPQTQWAPAWVSWHEGGGYVGWAPLHPSSRVSRSGSVEVNVAVISPRAFVFVEPRHFLQPVRPSTVVVNNTTIINKTVNITNTKIVNKTVINEGPRTTIIEQASGRKVQPVAVQELRRNEEAPAAARQRTARAHPERQAPAPARAAAEPEKQVPAPIRAAVEPIDRNVPADPARRVRDLNPNVQAEPPKDAGPLRRKAQAESEQRQRETQNTARELARKNQLESEQRVRQQAEQRTPAVPPRNQDSEKKALREFDPRTGQPVTKVPAEPQRNGKEGKATVKKGAKDAGEKGGKKPDQIPPEKLVEPAVPKN